MCEAARLTLIGPQRLLAPSDQVQSNNGQNTFGGASRISAQRIDQRGETTMDSMKVLFLAASPKRTPKLALDEEIREITQKVRLSGGGDFLNVISTWAVRPDDLLQYLNEHEPQIVHFSGHGSPSGEIVLVGSNGRPKAVSPHALKALFSTLKYNIEVVVLNACYSKLQGQAINEVIDFVIGMNAEIGDKAAIVFAASFYRALGFDRTVQEAFDQARTAILLEGIPEENTPVLLVKAGGDPKRRVSGPPKTSQKEPSRIEVDLLLKVVDRFQLIRQRQESDRKLYEDFVVPAMSDLEKLHQNYLETFQSYRREIEAKTNPLTPDHPVLGKIEADSLYFAQLRSKLMSIHELRTDSVFGTLMEKIYVYTAGGELNKKILLEGRRQIPNASRSYAITGLTEVFSLDTSKAQKRQMALKLLDRVVSELQWCYSEVIKENGTLKKSLLDHRVS
jgi:hypothetical protein